ncbi:MAG: tetratricopeptide repeat protein [Planctomycetaceae bacterium]|nr:tetratricopeptide repeat protein [Planctomycetaceae bacterium]
MADLNVMYDEATALKDQGDLEGAVAKLKEVLTEDETFVLAHTAIAVHLQKLGQNDEALTHAKRVVELEPDDPFSQAQLSVIAQRCGQITAAEDALARSNTMGSGGCGSGGCGSH